MITTADGDRFENEIQFHTANGQQDKIPVIEPKTSSSSGTKAKETGK